MRNWAFVVAIVSFLLSFSTVFGINLPTTSITASSVGSVSGVPSISLPFLSLPSYVVYALLLSLAVAIISSAALKLTQLRSGANSIGFIFGLIMFVYLYLNPSIADLLGNVMVIYFAAALVLAAIFASMRRGVNAAFTAISLLIIFLLAFLIIANNKPLQQELNNMFHTNVLTLLSLALPYIFGLIFLYIEYKVFSRIGHKFIGGLIMLLTALTFFVPGFIFFLWLLIPILIAVLILYIWLWLRGTESPEEKREEKKPKEKKPKEEKPEEIISPKPLPSPEIPRSLPKPGEIPALPKPGTEARPGLQSPENPKALADLRYRNMAAGSSLKRSWLHFHFWPGTNKNQFPRKEDIRKYEEELKKENKFFLNVPGLAVSKSNKNKEKSPPPANKEESHVSEEIKNEAVQLTSDQKNARKNVAELIKKAEKGDKHAQDLLDYISGRKK